MKAANNTEIRLGLEKLKYFKNDEHVVTNDTKKKEKEKRICKQSTMFWRAFSLEHNITPKFQVFTVFWGYVPFGWSRSGSMIQHHLDQHASKEPLNPIWKKENSLVPFMHHDPRDLGNEKSTGAEMLPSIVCGIATGDANSLRSLWLIWLVPVPFSFLKWHLEFNSKWYTLINPLHKNDSPEHSIPSPANPGLQTHRRPPNTSSTHRPLGWHFWGHFSLPTKEVNHVYSWDQLHKSNCYTAGNFFPPARALIGYLEVTWRVTMKLFPAKFSEQCPATHECWPTTAVTARFNEFPASSFPAIWQN